MKTLLEGVRLTDRGAGIRASRIVDARAAPRDPCRNCNRCAGLEYLLSQLNRWLPQIPGPASNTAANPSRVQLARRNPIVKSDYGLTVES